MNNQIKKIEVFEGRSGDLPFVTFQFNHDAHILVSSGGNSDLTIFRLTSADYRQIIEVAERLARKVEALELAANSGLPLVKAG